MSIIQMGKLNKFVKTKFSKCIYEFRMPRVRHPKLSILRIFSTIRSNHNYVQLGSQLHHAQDHSGYQIPDISSSARSK